MLHILYQQDKVNHTLARSGENKKIKLFFNCSRPPDSILAVCRLSDIGWTKKNKIINLAWKQKHYDEINGYNSQNYITQFAGLYS